MTPAPTALITGITGQDGSYLAEFLLARNYRVIGMMRADSPGLYDRLASIRSRVELVQGDLLDQTELSSIVDQYRPREIYNFAARASSSQLFSEPLLTSEFNGLAPVRLLESIRTVDPTIRFCQASSSEIYGDAPPSPQNETTPCAPSNPYGIAKLFAHQMVNSYRKSHHLFACSSILFNHESPRRGVEFVTRKISIGAARIHLGLDTHLRLGSLAATRDWGYAGDYVQGMWKMLQAQTPADYVLATGISHTVEEFCAIAFQRVGLNYRHHVLEDTDAHRKTDSVRLGDSTKARRELEWTPTVEFEDLVHMMVDSDVSALKDKATDLMR